MLFLCLCQRTTRRHFISWLFLIVSVRLFVPNVVNAMSWKVLDIFSPIFRCWCIFGQRWMLQCLGSKRQRLRSQHDEGSSGRRHREVNAVHRFLISSCCCCYLRRHSASHCVCVCVSAVPHIDCISLGGKGSVLYPVLFSCFVCVCVCVCFDEVWQLNWFCVYVVFNSAMRIYFRSMSCRKW